MLDRKDFLKSLCGLCVLSASGLLLTSSSACVSKALLVKTNPQGEIRLPLSSFAIQPLQIIRTNAWDYDLAVNLRADGSVETFSLQCTHADQEVQSTPQGYVCTLHGSMFNKEGLVVKGPASKPLKKVKTFIKDQEIVIVLYTPS